VTYPATIEYLYGIRLFGQKLGLETMRYLLELMGNPERRLRFIHIAGTNGKGSVAAMCHAVLTAAGYRTGLYTSPHLVSFCERFQINGQSIRETEVVRLVEQLKPVLDQVAAHPEFRQPTFFEAVTALALQYFREQNVDVVVWETGLGGRLDATNVVTPLVSVITNIAFDHMQYLGETLAQIASEKAGIIKPHVPVITAATDADADAVIRGQAALLQCPVTLVEAGSEFVTPLLGRHQVINCATAVAALRATGLEISDAAMRDGLARTNWLGRFQIVGKVVLDGAHNAEAARRLAVTLQDCFSGRRMRLIIGVLRDKNYDEMCRILAPLADTIVCVPVNSERTSDPNQLAELCRQANPQAAVRVSTLANVGPAEELTVITGSLFLVGEAMEKLGLGSPASRRELVLQ
jgi:dihydrofolate synthase / folylpolyglutamate synthase